MGFKTLPGTDPRSLMVNHLSRKVRESSSFKLDDDPDTLKPNHMRLFAYYKPSLEAGQYIIEAQQQVTSPDVEGFVHNEPLSIYNHTTGHVPLVPQKFNVIAPQFSLDPKLVNSHYPPDGHADEARVLPHIVFNDPHVPWERDAGETINSQQDKDIATDGTAATVYRNMVPWLALIVFDPAELKLAPGEGEKLQIPSYIAPGADVKDLEAKVLPSNSFSMSVKDYLGLDPASRINYEAGYLDPDTKGLNSLWTDPTDGLSVSPEGTNVIFPTKKLFGDIFANPADQSTHNIDSFRYMAHVREVNTVGFPDAGVEASGLFSIVVSHRTGNFNISQPTTQICHLVSLEHIDSTYQQVNKFVTKNPTSTDRIAMVSLYSWIYTALPPNPVNFVDTITNLVENQQMLRVNQFAKLPDAIKLSDAAKQVTSRLKLGYTMCRWRAETGEEVSAFNRGPLVPEQVVSPPVQDWAGASNTSKEYQILDKGTGLMDLSYSAAWQLGKTLAISDTTFSSALMRLRSQVHAIAASNARNEANNVACPSQILGAVAKNIKVIHSLTKSAATDPQRVPLVTTRELLTDLGHPRLAELFQRHLCAAVNFQGSAETEIYNEFNAAGANNTDWVTIFTWLSEKLYLSGIPAHYLIPEPSYLPSEAIRFFYIDDTWVDCLIDGALSVANHLERDDDTTRLRIKQTFNVYLSKNIVDFTRDDGTRVQVKPQIPSCGFILRSALVKVMPDLRITVTWKDAHPDMVPVCRYTKLNDTTILCLLDRSLEQLKSIELAQPPHQQRFSLGYQLIGTPPTVEFKLRQLYTRASEERLESEWPVVPDNKEPTIEQQQSWFDFPSRCLKTVKMASEMNSLLQKDTPEDGYVDKVTSSVVLGLELNDPSYYFRIVPTSLGSDNTPGLDNVPLVQRQLWVGLERKPKHPDPGPIPKPDPSPALPATPAKPISQNIQPPSNSPGGNTTGKTLSDYLGTQPSNPIHRDRRFLVTIYADYKGLPPTHRPDGRPFESNVFDSNHHLPTQNNYYYDIVVSIRRDPLVGASEYELTEIGVEFPTDGVMKAPGQLESLLEQSYTGPGVRMLNNQRFVPYLNFTADYLQVRLMPRYASARPFMVINDARTVDISFRLGEANVSRVARATDKVIFRDNTTGKLEQVKTGPGAPKVSKPKVKVYEKYKVDDSGVDSYVRYDVEVVKIDKMDPGR
ncbi:uncharacterized protein A1O5_06340 [Cladophialophora psammophila CBS 110553]|uniref:Uncharacterized protein n=1 Tax=Cladophialophora psammophila CBS 110553 TaxID=1182543 RepID=W9WQ16_9EURO|nr:uncharacterized protein A1O5_06340 [Cladophialophora psammophila CBS 110553]EXJ70272.1 hypothetical protein A1O5_06340 [Cladophialophora psammophila CBS 110553]